MINTSDQFVSTHFESRRFGVLVKTFPKLSETFVLSELLGLERLGLEFRVFSLRSPTDGQTHAANAALRAPVSYLPTGLERQLKILFDHVLLLRRSPRRYLSAIGFAARCAGIGAAGDFWQAGWLAARVLELGITHLHVHFVNRPAAVAELATRLSGISYSLSAHAKDIYLTERSVLQRRLAGARFAVTCSEYNRRHLAALNSTNTPLLRLYHGVDLHLFRPRSKLPRNSPPLLLSVGRLREKKGFRTLIEACAVLSRSGVPYRCQIVGYGPEQANLQALIGQLGLQSSVCLIGPMVHQQLIDLYRQATLFVLPCQIAADGDRDGIPNVLLEAMAMQLPVIATPISGIPELIDDHTNGLLIAPRQPVELATAIQTVLTQPALAARWGQAGRQAVQARFDNRINLRRLYQLLVSARDGLVAPGGLTVEGLSHD